MARTTHPKTIPHMVYANADGEILDLPDLGMAGRAAGQMRVPELFELIPLPEGSELFVLPDRLPVGTDPETGEPLVVEEDPGNPGAQVRAVAAFISPAHTGVLTAAYEPVSAMPQMLPLFAYTAVGWLNGRFWTAAFRSDPDERQDVRHLDLKAICRRTRASLRRHPENRLIQHLGTCSLTYGCPAARNYFMGRWEAPLPTSPACNADCLGCISLQTSGCCPSTQQRIGFVPTPDEIADVAVAHIKKAERPVVSFGQGCEGEPLLQAKTIEKAIHLIRRQTAAGTINLNSNASMPDRVERLAHARLDSIRVSMSSARPATYSRYYRPKGYSFEDVKESIRVMKRAGRFVSINYFILPGFTDDPEESAAFFDLVETCRPDLIQLRNLNMDPDWYFAEMQHEPRQEPIGIMQWHARLRAAFPWLRYGYFNPYLGGNS